MSPHRGHHHRVRVAGRISHRRYLARVSRASRSATEAHSEVAARMVAHTDLVSLQNTGDINLVASHTVLAAIAGAARDTGVDPDLLMALAWRESRFNPAAKNRHSSASGLLQFTSGTWLRTIQEFGGRYGAAVYAASIHRGTSGRIFVHNRYMLTTILKLRYDPVLSARMAAEIMRRQSTAALTLRGRTATSQELYLSHVLGADGSARFIAAMTTRPTISSAEVIDQRLLRNAGLLAIDGHPMTVANTYLAIGMMLGVHRTDPSTAASRQAVETDATTPRLIELAQPTLSSDRWCTFSDLVVCSGQTPRRLRLPLA